MRQGFTIIELLVVISVISILIGISIPRFEGIRAEAHRVKARAETRVIKAAVEVYYIRSYPSSYPETSTTIIDSVLKHQSPLIVAETLYDPFLTTATEYNYMRSDSGRFYVITSVGLNGISDITGINNEGILQGTNDDDFFATNGTSF